MHRGQADVFVDPAVAGDVVSVEQFVVIGQVVAARANGLRIADKGVGIRLQNPAGNDRHGVVGDVVEEGMAGAHRVHEAYRIGRIAFDKRSDIIGGAGNAIRPVVDPNDNLREAVRPLDEVAIGVSRQQRAAVDIGVGQIDTQHVACLGLDHLPGCHTTDFNVVSGAKRAIRPQVTVSDQPACRYGAAGGKFITAQEHLMRRVRAIGLVLVHERRGGVGVLMDVVGRAKNAIRPWLVGRAGQDHEVRRATWNKQRIIRLQRDEDSARTAFGHQVQAMIEELPEEGHPGVERRGQSRIRRGVLEQVHIAVVASTELSIQPGAGNNLYTFLEHIVVTHRAEVEHTVQARVECRGIGRRVVRCLIDDQVTDGARLRVDHKAVVLRIRRSPFRRIEDRIAHAREEVIGGAKLGVVNAVEVHQVVV
ncbi:hypothetical protein D3C85_756040 [compost metagenome]